MGNQDKAYTCLDIAYNTSLDSRSTWEYFSQLSNALGPLRDNLYVQGPDKQFFQRLVKDSSFPPDWWARGAQHQSALYDEGTIFESLIPNLSRIAHPTLLIRGYYDAVFGLDQLWQYRHAKPDTNLVVAAESSHFVHVEEPELFATAVANYLNSKPRTITPS